MRWWKKAKKEKDDGIPITHNNVMLDMDPAIIYFAQKRAIEKLNKKIIEKKAHPDLFEAVLRGDKKFDLRLADFECKVGDVLVLKEWNPETKKYTGRVIEKEITFVLRTKDLKFWSKEEVEKHGFQIMSLK